MLAAFVLFIYPPLMLLYLVGLLGWLWMKRTESGRRFASHFARPS